MEAQPPTTTSQPNKEDDESHNSGDLTRRELIQRRASRLTQLTKCYKDHYWLLMEDVRTKHREFIWKYGNNTSSHAQNSVVFANNNNYNNNNDNDNDNDDVNEERNGGKIGLGLEEELVNRCNWHQCRLKAMALTSYCFMHIAKDPNQVLYNACQYAIRCFCGPEKPYLCEKPVLRSIVPSLCPHHTRLTETNIRKALKKNGASVSVANKLGSKFHLVLTEYVRLIQSQRRARLVDNTNARHDKR